MGPTVQDGTSTASTREQGETASLTVSPDTDHHTSVVYVHGIGNQRRYEEVSHLIDQLDRYLFVEHEQGRSKGTLSNIKVRVEPLRGSTNSELVGYIRTVFRGSGENRRSFIRFYELFWAPLMADVKSPWSVLRWLFKQPLRPWRTAFSPWRERQRLRRGSLVSLFESERALPATVEQRDCGQLLELYDDFEGLSAHRSYAHGTFDEFLKFIRNKEKSRPDRMKRHLVLARMWRRTYILEELRNALVLNSLALTLLLLAIGALLSTYQLLQIFVAEFAVPLHNYQISVSADWKTAAGILITLGGLLGLGRALTNYVGDVEAWATYEETDLKYVARSKVLDRGMELLTHVLNDDACHRVAIVAHSLGTSIALDTILGLRQRNLATDSANPMSAAVRLDKISHFITMGSPIDKIEYFFESYCSTSHRYKRVVEALRGDIDSAPFSYARIPHIHWVNFWDEGDAISGPLQSPSGTTRQLQRVDNVEIASFTFPEPASSHTGYFSSRTVIASLFEIICHDAFSFWPLLTDKMRSKQKYDQRCLGPGTALKKRRVWIIVALSIPWLTLIGAVGYMFGLRAVSIGAWSIDAIATVILAVGIWISRRSGQRDPIKN